MLLIDRLLTRDREIEHAEVDATAPEEGVFVDAKGDLLPEYFIELVAQAMAAVNGYDSRCDGLETGRGFLVGIEDFSWKGKASSGEKLKVEMKKNLEFGPVTVMSGKVINSSDEILAGGEIKAWEEK